MITGSGRTRPVSHTLWSPLKVAPGFSSDAPSICKREIQSPANHTHLRYPIARTTSHGILTVCPSGTAFAIPLGPTDPWLIIIAKETLIFRRSGFSPELRLLVPTFLLLCAPAWVTPSPSSRQRIFSYHVQVSKNLYILSFGTTLNPDYLRCGISR